jgi:hypothetical protein
LLQATLLLKNTKILPWVGLNLFLLGVFSFQAFPFFNQSNFSKVADDFPPNVVCRMISYHTLFFVLYLKYSSNKKHISIVPFGLGLNLNLPQRLEKEKNLWVHRKPKQWNLIIFLSKKFSFLPIISTRL